MTGRHRQPAPIRIVVADDHPVVREGLSAMLQAETDLEVIGEADNGEEAVAVVIRLHPDVVLMDLRMPAVDGADATARITQAAPGTRVLVLTTYDTDADILRAVEAGATGYLLKDTPRAQLADSVRAAARGETVLAPPVAAKLVGHLRRRDARHETRRDAQREGQHDARREGQHDVRRELRGPALTARELQVLALVAEGLTNAEIGRRLYIGESTVKSHLLKVFGKLDVDDRTHAVTVAMQRGLLPHP